MQVEAVAEAVPAAEALMSRAAFAARFRQGVGMPPLRQVTRWRMGETARLLQRGADARGAIAERAGYASDAAFSRASRQHTGTTPGAYRRTRHLQAQPPTPA